MKAIEVCMEVSISLRKCVADNPSLATNSNCCKNPPLLLTRVYLSDIVGDML